MARQAHIILAQDAEEAIDFAPSDVQVFDIQEDEQHPAREEAVAGDVDPAVGGGALDGDVASLHDALLARVEDHLEDALDDDGVVEAMHAVHRRHAAGGEVDHAADGAVFDSDAGLWGH